MFFCLFRKINFDGGDLSSDAVEQIQQELRRKIYSINHLKQILRKLQEIKDRIEK